MQRDNSILKFCSFAIRNSLKKEPELVRGKGAKVCQFFVLGDRNLISPAGDFLAP